MSTTACQQLVVTCTRNWRSTAVPCMRGCVSCPAAAACCGHVVTRSHPPPPPAPLPACGCTCWCLSVCLSRQVVSRAHRMGAVAPVHVELFAMRHTAEEHMVELRWGEGGCVCVCAQVKGRVTGDVCVLGLVRGTVTQCVCDVLRWKIVLWSLSG